MSVSNPFVYAGRGRKLRQVAASTGNAVSDPEVTVIPNNGFSEIIAGHDGLEIMFEFVFGAAATGDVLIEKVSDSVATTAGTTYATASFTAVLSGNWNAGKPLQGSFRIKNTSGQTVIVYYNNRLR